MAVVPNGTRVVIRNIPWKGNIATVVSTKRSVLMWGKRTYKVQLELGQKDGGRYVTVTKVVPEGDFRAK